MSSKQKKTKGLTSDQLKRVWQQISISDWHELFREYQPQNNFVVRAKNTLLGRCPHPDHADQTPSFWLYTGPDDDDRCFGVCYGCGFFTRDPFELVSIAQGVDTTEAFQYLQTKYALNFLPKKAAAELEAQRLNQRAKNAIYAAARFTLVDAVANPKTHPYAKEGIDWLLNQRKIDKGSLSQLPVGLMPPLLDLQKTLTLQYKQKFKSWRAKPSGAKPEDVTDAVTAYLEAAYNSSKFNGAIMFPLHTTPRDIGRIKLRVPTSGPKDFNFPDDPYEERLGLFGLGWDQYNSFFSQGKLPFIYLVEGEMDVLSVMDRFLRSGNIRFPIVSAGGTSSAAHIEPILHDSGIETVYIVGDSPGKGNGDVVVQRWLEQMRKLPIRIFIGWDQLQPATDLDEAIHDGKLGIAKVEEALWKKTDENFVMPWSWAFERARHALDGLDANDHRAHIEKASEHGRYLQHRLEEAAYVQAISKAYDHIPARILKLEITTRENNALGFIFRIREALADMFHVVGTEVKQRGRTLILYHKEKHHFVRILLDSETAIVAEFAPLGGMLLEFIENNVGFPSFLDHPNDVEGNSIRNVTLALRLFLKEAMNSLAQGAVDVGFADRRVNGYHWINTPGNAPLQYLIVHNEIFRFEGGTDTSPSAPIKLPAPVDNNIVFGHLEAQSTMQNWLPEIPTVESLAAASKEDMVQLYHDLVEFYTCGFQFQNHANSCQLIAATVMMMPVMDAMSRPPLLSIIGATSSGKSSLVATLAHTPEKAEIQMLYHSVSYSGKYTEAGVTQAAFGDSRLRVFDEFELDRGNHIEIQKLYELFRAFINGESERLTGTPGGRPNKISLRHPIWLSSISTSERPQDTNRWLTTDTVAVPHRDPSEISILKQFSSDRIAKMRKVLNMGIYAHAQELRQARIDIKYEFNTSFRTTLSIPVEARFAENLFAAAAMMKFLGLDWHKFITSYVESNEFTFLDMETVNESDTKLHMLLRGQGVYDHEMRQKTSIGQLLLQSEKREAINNSSCGTYYDSSQKLILFLLDQAIPQLIHPETIKQNRITSMRMRDALRRHKFALTSEEIIQSGVIGRAQSYLGAGISLADVCVLHADKWLQVTQQPQQGALKIVEVSAPVEPEKEEEKTDDDLTNNCDW